MKLSLIKKIYKKIPYPLTLPIEKAPFELFCGGGYRKTIKNIEDFHNYDSSFRKEISETLLIDYLNDSIENTRFYKDWAKSKRIKSVGYADEVFEFPVLEKEQVLEDSSWFTDERYVKNSYEVTTGGSTGRQLKLLMHNSVYFKEWAFVNYYLKSSGVDVNARRLCLRGVARNDSNLISFNPLYKEMLISPFKLNLANVSKEIKRIKSYSAQWIHGYPSSVAEFAMLLDSLNVRLENIKHILLVSEKIYPEQLDIINKVFNAEILTFYGSTERVVFAPFIKGIYFPDAFYGFSEVVDKEILGTGFLNPSTRLIRYRLSDEIDTSVEVGEVKEISDIIGRWGREYLIGKTGVKINMTALNIHSNEMNNVARFQFHQKTEGFCTLKVMVKRGVESFDPEKLSSLYFKKTAGEISFKTEVVDNIPLTSRGKSLFIVNELI